MGKLQSKHAGKRRENPEGDSFVVNAFLRRAMEECERYSASDHKLNNIQEFPHSELKGRQFLDHHCPLEVVLPPEKAAEGCDSYLQYPHTDPGPDRQLLRGGDAGKGSGKKRISLDDLECDVSVEEDNRQEWIFTLYDFDNSGKVTKEDMSSLMHTIYDVVDASVNHSSCHSKRKTLRVKLTVTPERCPRRRDHISTGPDRETARLHQEEGRSADRRLSSHIRPAHPGQSSEGQHYCVDENTERRNHYLDLAGIENYTSRFEGSTPPPPPQETHVRTSQSQNRSRSQEPEAHAAHQRHSQVIGENYTPLEARGRGASHFLKSPKGTSKGAGVGGTNGGIERGKSSKYHAGGHYPPQPPPLQTLLHTGNSSSGGHGGQDVYHLPSSSHHQHPLQHSHSKRLRAKAREGQGLSPSKTPLSPHSNPQQQQQQAPPPPPCLEREKEREQVSGLHGSPGSFVLPLVQRHEHRHHHEHHHHHHYHHHHQT
ncbi:protein naked cuticle homolog 2-like [Salmo salar]|uniref:Protein naked cuticle homolog n=1 Tax=Salmo salar TaxID=8030 RepID=A0ABM3D2G6_SALSA|nr:protein naked cuticle homolog 2-like [Salmo salar]|eukprot:XP_014005300.1 PREDICTED: protein naked cuticle homolog 2-like [Salmo salar]